MRELFALPLSQGSFFLLFGGGGGVFFFFFPPGEPFFFEEAIFPRLVISGPEKGSYVIPVW